MLYCPNETRKFSSPSRTMIALMNLLGVAAMSPRRYKCNQSSGFGYLGCLKTLGNVSSRHSFFSPNGLYSPEDKQKLAEAITKLYTDPPVSLPAFIDMEEGSLLVGGKSTRVRAICRGGTRRATFIDVVISILRRESD